MTKDELMKVIEALEIAQHSMQTDMAVTYIDDALLKCMEELKIKQEPLTDIELALMAFNDVPDDWNDINYRQCWIDGYLIGARAV